ncbi:MAG: hypothetical protein HFG78_09680 [Hungatella sp.]|nr:hypothetical protein [Hungatella sp.]MCI9500469.1 hypothetical protein [Hungatella sp.]
MTAAAGYEAKPKADTDPLSIDIRLHTISSTGLYLSFFSYLFPSLYPPQDLLNTVLGGPGLIYLLRGSHLSGINETNLKSLVVRTSFFNICQFLETLDEVIVSGLVFLFVVFILSDGVLFVNAFLNFISNICFIFKLY